MLNRKQFLKLLSINTTGGILLSKNSLGLVSFKDLIKNYSDESGKRVPEDLHPNLFDAVKGYKIIQSDDEENLLIIAYELTNDIIANLPKGRNVAIFCYKALFKNGSAVTLDGKNLYLLSNKIEFGNSTISTHPEKAQDANPIQQNQRDGLVQDRNNVIAPAGDDLAVDVSEKKRDNPINGRNGGDITINSFIVEGKITLISRGGKGGKGQRGANGRNGADDKNVDHIIFFDPVKRPTEGSINGFPGEIGGTGALGGFGGDGGNINLFIPNKNNLKVSDTLGGLQGDSGEPGNSGYGGVGIDHSIIRFEQTASRGGRDARPGKPRAIYNDADIPSIGQNAAGAKLPNAQQRNGQAGKISINSADEFFKYLPIEFAKLLLLKAESLYLNSTFKKNDSNLNEAYELLSFIYKISSNNPGFGFDLPDVYSNPTGFGVGPSDKALFLKSNLFYLQKYTFDKKEWESVKQKCCTYLNQIQLNLDFFGNPPNYAPNLAYDFLAENYLSNVPLIAGFGDFAKNIEKMQNGLQKNIIAANDYVTQCRNNIENLNSEIRKYKNSIISLNSELQIRIPVIENLKIQLQNDQAELQKAIDDMGGCTFGMVLQCLTAVVAIAAAVYTCGAASGAAVAAVGSVVSGLEAINSLAELKEALSNQKSVIRSGVANVSTDMEKISDNIETVKKNVKVIQDAFKKSKGPVVDIPDFLIAVDTSKFDGTIDKIINNPDLSDHAKTKASQFKADYHYFVDYIMVTNQKRLEITSDILSISLAYHEKELQNQQIDRSQTIILTDKISLSDKQDIFEVYYKIKLQASYLIYLQNKSLAYQHPGENIYKDGNYNQLEIENLNANAFSLNWQKILLLNKSDSAIKSPKSTLSPLIIEFVNHDGSNLINNPNKNFVSNLSFQNFKIPQKDNNGDTYFSCQFDIPSTKVNHKSIFLDGYNIKVRGTIVYLKSKSLSNYRLNFKLTHLGNSIVTIDKDFNQVQFFEDITTTTLYSKVSPAKNRVPSFTQLLANSTDPKDNLIINTSSGDFAQLGRSPFASWKLDVPLGFNPSLSEVQLKNIISDLTAIEFYFYYSYQQG